MQVKVIISPTVYLAVFCCISQVKIGVSFDAKVDGGEWPWVLKSVCLYLCPNSVFAFSNC